MSDEGKIASRIFSKHLVIHDEFDDDEDEDDENDKDKDKDSDIPDIGNLSEEFTHAAAIGGNPEEIKIEGSNELFEGDEKMVDESKGVVENEVAENENPKLQTEDFNFDNDEGETLVLNFQTPPISPDEHDEILDKSKVSGEGLDDLFIGTEPEQKTVDPISFGEPQEIILSQEPVVSSEDKEPDMLEVPEFEEFESEEFPQEISLFQSTVIEDTEQPEAVETINFESQPSEVENVEVPKFEFIDEGDDNEEELEVPIDDDSIIDDSQGRVIEEDIIEEPLVEEVEDFGKDLTEEEKKVDGLAAEFPELQDMSSEIKGFLLNNIDILTKERLAICLDSDLALEELKGFFVGNLSESHKERVYSKLRKIEMQYIFENFIQCFNIESFTRKKEAIDGKTVTNIVVLRENIFIDAYESLNTAQDIDVKSGESSFILSDELEIRVENYLDEIKAAKLNAENVYLMILDGAIVDDDAVKLATRYGIRIVDMDTPISTVNRNLEEIKRGIIV